MAKAKRTLGYRNPDQLKPHPKQSKHFADLSEAEFKALVRDLKKNGQTTPVEILVDETIVAGHQRVRAAKQLKWEKVRVWVREDLGEAGSAASEERLLEENLNRRQLSRLGQARLYCRLRELAKDQGRKEVGPLRDVLAKRFDVTGRTLERWVKVLDAPVEVQQAVDRGELSMTQGIQVAKLSLEKQQAIVKRLQAGEDPKGIVKDMAPKATPKKNAASQSSQLKKALRMVLKAVRSPDPEGPGGSSTSHYTIKDLPLLEEVGEHIQMAIVAATDAE